MPDPADDRAAYLEAMRRAEAASGIERDAEGNETNGIESIVRGETPVATPELQEAVPVQASDQPLVPEPVVEKTPDTPIEQQEALEVVAPDPLAKIAELETRLAEKDSFIGRQSTEIGDLRSAVEDIRQKQAEPVAPSGQLAPVTTTDIEFDPAEATLRAFENARRAGVADDPTLKRAFEAWKDEDPFSAGQWLTDERLKEQSKKFDAKLAETQEEVDKKTAPLAQQQEEQAQTLAWAQAFDTAKLGRPDFIENAERLLSEVAPLHPSFLANLQSADPKVKADALIALYAIDKIGNPEAVALELGEKAKEAATEAATALAAGAVVSGQLTAGQTAVEKSDEELEAAAYVSRMGSKPSLSRGWTGRS